MKKLAFIIILVMLSKTAMASCFGERFNLTHTLLNNNDNHSIFVCQITTTYFGLGGFTSLAVVTDVYRGTPMDTVRIVTGAYTTEGGTKLKPGTNWLIISESQDDYHYTATICYNLSSPMTENDVGCGYKQRVYGDDIVRLIKQVDELRTSRYTGSKKLFLKESLIAEGKYLDGNTHGSWKHYSHRIEVTKQNLELDIEYVDGIPDGKTTRYVLDHLPLTIESVTKTKNGKLISKNIYNYKFYNYKYIDQNKRITNFYRINENGDTIIKYREVGLINSNLEDFYLHYKDGEYINLIDSSSYNCLCSGRYYKGAKIGEWKYYDKNGNIVKRKKYEFVDTLNTEIKMFEEDGSIKVIGTTNEHKPIGKWKYFFDKKLEYEVYYNSKSEIITKIGHYPNGGKKVTPYMNAKPQGTEHTYFKSDELTELTNYDKGIKHGLHYKFDEDGNFIYHSNFVNGIETTISRTDGKANIVNGFRTGYNIQLNFKTGKKLHEGNIWMGYRTGEYISYKKNGDYTILYYETDKNLLVSNCNSDFPTKVSYYNKDNELIKERSY